MEAPSFLVLYFRLSCLPMARPYTTPKPPLSSSSDQYQALCIAFCDINQGYSRSFRPGPRLDVATLRPEVWARPDQGIPYTSHIAVHMQVELTVLEGEILGQGGHTPVEALVNLADLLLSTQLDTCE